MAITSFKQKNIIISGGSKGIGKAIALGLAEQGANLCIMARSPKPLKEVVQEINKKFPDVTCFGLSVDAGKHSEVKKAIKEIVKKMGTIDGLISNAGLAIPKHFHETTVDEFEQLNQTKYMSAVYLTKETYPYLNDGSFISFTSSVVGYMGVFGYSTYVGPNFALVGFAETLHQELANKNIQISVLCPPDTDTPGYEEEEKTKPHETKKLSGNVKLMKPEAVADIFLKKLKNGKFLITVNFDSSLFYFVKRMMPVLMIKIMTMMVKGIQKKMKNA